MILLKMTAVGTDGNRVMLHFDDGTKMRVSTSLVADFGLYKGMELEEETLAELSDSARLASAKSRALRMVSASSISERQLKQRLIQRGERPEDAQEAAQWLKELGAVDDAAMAHRVVRASIDKGYGEARIRQELYKKGIPREYWDEALEELPDMTDWVEAFLERRLRGQEPDQKTIKKLTDALLRRGHSYDVILRAMRRCRDRLGEVWDEPEYFDY
ncbi:MAG: regulatory protein RecX [Oscillospiraceae bacterium]|nr:regulatory protein RecX [Oscillospiraceae bacterium]